MVHDDQLGHWEAMCKSVCYADTRTDPISSRKAVPPITKQLTEVDPFFSFPYRLFKGDGEFAWPPVMVFIFHGSFGLQQRNPSTTALQYRLFTIRGKEVIDLRPPPP